jgi:hypothetical protein
VKRSIARWPPVWLASGAVLACVLSVSACVPNIKLLGARIEQVPIEAKPAEFKGSWPQDSALLRVELQTSRNLRAIADAHELNVGVDAFLCDNRRHVLSAMPYLFDEVGRVDANHGPGNGSKTIWFYLAQESKPRGDTERGPDFPAYDLRTDVRDMCIEVHGGSMLGQTMRSNRLRVSAKTQ